MNAFSPFVQQVMQTDVSADKMLHNARVAASSRRTAAT
jgi:hypothetical protein